MSDPKAETAVKEVMAKLSAAGQPLNISTVPKAAIASLDRNDGDPSMRVYGAIDDMVRRGELVAPQEPWKNWHLN